MFGLRDVFLRPRYRLSPSGRSARDLCVAAGAGLVAAAFVLHHWTAATPGPVPVNDGKLADRLAFEQEVVPTRETRIFDTVAMFSQLPAEPAPWSEAAVPTLPPMPVRVAHDAASRPAQMPRLVVSQATPSKPAAARPPARPPADLGPKPGQSASSQGPAAARREPLRVAGWSLPGSQFLPTGRDAVRVVSFVGTKAVDLGSGTADVVQSGASVVGDALSSAGRRVAGTIGLE